MALTTEQRKELKTKFFVPSKGQGAVSSSAQSADLKARIERTRSISGYQPTQNEENGQSIVEAQKTAEMAKNGGQATPPVQEEAPKPGFLARTVERVKEAGKKIKENFAASERGLTGAEDGQTTTETAVNSVGAIGSAVAGTVFDGLFSAAKTLVQTVTPDAIEKKFGEAGKSFLDSDTGKAALVAISKGAEFYDEFSKDHPRAARNIEGLLGVAEIIPAAETVTGVKNIATQSIKKLAKEAPGAIENFAKGRAEAQILKQAAKVEEQIAPTVKEMTKNQVREALDQGRKIETGRIARFFGKADEVVTEKRTSEAARAVVERIPKAAKMNDQEIATAAKDTIRKIAKDVEPKLQQAPLKEEIKQDIVNSYVDVQKKQLETPILSPATVRRAQKQFQSSIEEVIDGGNVNDIWNAIKKYDSSVEKSVKEATSQSSDRVQALKDIWLENRRILRDSLDDALEGVDPTVAKDFKDMYGLYTARENVINNARLFKGSKELRNKIITGVVGGGLAGTATYKLMD